MSKRPFCQMALSMLLGICIAAYGNVWWLMAVLFLLVAAACLLRKQRAALLRIVLMTLLLLTGWQRYGRAETQRVQCLSCLEDGMQLVVQGKLSKKEVREQQYIYELTSCAAGSILQKSPVFCNRILVYSDADIASIGEILVLDGKIELWKSAVNEGNFDEKFFYETRGINFKLKDIRLISAHGKENSFKEGIFRLKNRLAEVYVQAMGKTESGIMATMVLGNKNMLESEVKRLYQICGLSHILAISGLHISVIGMSLYRLLRRLRFRFWEAGLLAGILMCAYGSMVGMGVSVQRAVLMFLLALGAQALGRSYDSLNALGMAALFLLLKNPRIFLDAGFQFSFAAVTGVVWVGNRNLLRMEEDEREKKRERRKSRLEPLWQTLFGSAAIQFAILPLFAWYYYEVPIYAILVNLLVLPCMGLLLSLGIAGGVAGLFSKGAAILLLFPCQKMLELGNWLCGCFAGLPGAMLIVGKPALWKMLFYYAGLIVLVWYLHQRSLIRKGNKKGRGTKRKGYIWTLERKQIVLGGLLLLFLLWTGKKEFEVDVLDVGQGDGSFLRTESGVNIFVDGGSSDVSKVGEYRILPFLKSKGIRQIDFWFVSHTDSDHISGLQEILEAGYPVENLVFAKNREQDEAFLNLTALAEKWETKLLYVEEGDVLHLGEAEIQVLSPVQGVQYADKNGASLVCFYKEEDFSGIFTGDIDMASEEKLLAGLAKKGEVDFYKAAHHGSNGSNSEAFLQALQPKMITVSCGARNRYGHPGIEAVERMEDTGARIFYTMESGQITIKRGKEGICAREYAK